jgi:hypothetical protein
MLVNTTTLVFEFPKLPAGERYRSVVSAESVGISNEIFDRFAVEYGKHAGLTVVRLNGAEDPDEATYWSRHKTGPKLTKFNEAIERLDYSIIAWYEVVSLVTVLGKGRVLLRVKDSLLGKE